MPPRVLILFNEPTLPADHPDADSEHDILYTADQIARILQGADLPVTRLGIAPNALALLEGLRTTRPDVVFNLYEGTAQWGNSEAYVSGILELSQLPFTGSPTQPLLLCRSKPLTKQLLAGAGLPTAPFFVVDGGLPVPECPLEWPVIVKPAREDASVGIDQKSVVTSQKELVERVDYIRSTYGPTVMVEQFVRGREFNVALIERGGELIPLPFTEILFVPPAESPDLWPIVSFDAKWRPGTRDFVATPVKNPADVTPELHAAITELAIRAFRLVGCRDYARIDFRIDSAGKPYILEVNPNPCISPLAGLAAALESAKIAYADFILERVRLALTRTGNSKSDKVIFDDHRQAALAAADVPAPIVDAAAAPSMETVRYQAVLFTGDRESLLPLVESAVPIEDRAEFRVLLIRETDWFIVKDESILGLACAPKSARDGTVRQLLAIAVDPGLRRRGVGSALLAAIESSGIRQVAVDLSSAAPHASLRQFLLARKYRPAGETPEYYRDGSARLTYLKTFAETKSAETR